MIPVHPEVVPRRPDQVRWVTPPGLLGFVGPAAGAPGDLGRLVAEGVVVGLDVEPDAVLVTLAPGRRWRVEGPEVRTALHAALDDPSGWSPAPGAVPADQDAVLERLAGAVLAGPAGDFVRSHGGVVELVDAVDGVVSVRLSGACRGCSAVATTLNGGLERSLRAAYPSLAGVRQVG